jgi:ABC-type multidrug transport system ATPase subunit
METIRTASQQQSAGNMQAQSSTLIDPGAAIVAEGLEKSFGNVRALAEIDLTIGTGELVALIGSNGSGKSTLLKMIFGLARPSAGRLQVLGLDPYREQPRLRPQVGYAGQDIALDSDLTGLETLRLFHALRGLPHHERGERLARLVEEYDLAPFCERRVGSYSGGQRQRLHLALETMHAPRLLLLDEPTASLDPNGRRSLWNRLAAWRDAGHTVVAATHDLADVASRCDRVILLERGHLIASDHPDDIIAAHSRACTIITLARAADDDSDILHRELRALPGAPEVAIRDHTITLWRDRHPDEGEPALDLLTSHGISYRRYERQERDLAGAYFRLTGHLMEERERGMGGVGERGRGRGGGGGGRGAGAGGGKRGEGRGGA